MNVEVDLPERPRRPVRAISGRRFVALLLWASSEPHVLLVGIFD
jgi:hypothetical protein